MRAVISAKSKAVTPSLPVLQAEPIATQKNRRHDCVIYGESIQLLLSTRRR